MDKIASWNYVSNVAIIEIVDLIKNAWTMIGVQTKTDATVIVCADIDVMQDTMKNVNVLEENAKLGMHISDWSKRFKTKCIYFS